MRAASTSGSPSVPGVGALGSFALRARAAAAALWRALAHGAAVWLPVACLVSLATPCVLYMLPAYESHLGHSYQPLKCLKFLASRGQAEHIYGPMNDLLLAPGYLASLAYWKLRGTFSVPSSEFPYGFERPLDQLTFLLLQGRVLFMLLVVTALAALLRVLARTTRDRLATLLAGALCVGTSASIAHHTGDTRPEAPMFAFTLAATAVWTRMVFGEPTRRQAFWLSVFAACAITAKELAAPVFVLPYLSFGVVLLRRARKSPAQRRRSLELIGVALGAGVGTYALLNVVYAPAVWWGRMQHWASGSGTDNGVWGGVGLQDVTLVGYLGDVLGCLVSTLGPVGALASAIALVTLVVARPRGWWLSMAPFVSLMALGLLPLGYVAERFYAEACITLVLPTALGLSVLFARVRRHERSSLLLLAAIATAYNFWFGTFAWHRLTGLDAFVERAVVEAGKDAGTFNVTSLHKGVPGKSRLEAMGYALDPRSLQELTDADPATLPERLYVKLGLMQFIEDAREMPARIEFLRNNGLEIDSWHGVEALGYRKIDERWPATPEWYPFDWSHEVDDWVRTGGLAIYERTER